MRAWMSLALLTGLMGCSSEDTDTDSDPDSDSETEAPGDCTTYIATYDLTGSTFDIDAAFDFTITCEEPYGDEDTMGPGVVTVRFAGDANGPVPGSAMILSYTMDQDFVTGVAGIASVHTELENAAALDVCGNAVGTLDGTTASWTGDALSNYCQTGQVSCEGAACGQFGSPAEGEPIVYDNVCSDMPLSDFTFSADFTTVSMAATVMESDDNQTTSLTLTGTQVSMEEDANTPACACP